MGGAATISVDTHGPTKTKKIAACANNLDVHTNAATKSKEVNIANNRYHSQ